MQCLYDSLKKNPVPSFSGIDEFDDWIEDLIEIDAILAGFACLASKNGKIKKNQIPDLKNLEETLSTLARNGSIDNVLLSKSKAYLELLKEIHEQLLLEHIE